MLRRSHLLPFYRSTSLRLLSIVKMPALSPTMEKGTLVAWDLKIGDKIEENTCLAKVQTDKATNDFNYVGDECYLARIIQEAGSVVTVGEPVALAVENAADVNSDEVKNWKPTVKKAAPAPAAPSPAATPKPASNTSTKSTSPSRSDDGKLSQEVKDTIERSGPAVLRLASSLTADQIRSLVASKSATGLRSRFTKADVLKFFPKVDFSVPNSQSPYVHSSSSSSAQGEGKSEEKKKQENKTNEKRADSSSQSVIIQPGVPGKFGIHDDEVLAFLMKKK